VNATDTSLIVTGLRTRAGSFALGPIDCAVAPGRVLAILGRSGAGKTMILDTIAGLRSSTEGRIWLAGREITHLPPEQRRVGYVFQNAALFPHLTVRQNVSFPLRVQRRRSPELTDLLLERFAITHLTERTPHTLSGGERQRVGLARALAAQPDLFLLDEPLSALDRPARDELRGVLRQVFSELAIPAVYVTHDREEALGFADEIAVVVTGKLQQLARPEEIVHQPADPTCAELIGWSHLGSATLRSGQLEVVGQMLPLQIYGSSLDGPVEVFYRPEALLLADDALTVSEKLRCPLTVEQILPTTPLARVTFVEISPLTALVLNRDVQRLHLRAGITIPVGLPPDSLRLFPRGSA